LFKAVQERKSFIRSTATSVNARWRRRRPKKLDLLNLCFDLSTYQVPALLTIAVASNTEVLNSIIKKVRIEEEREEERERVLFSTSTAGLTKP
jgi:hypothetical protein